MQNNTNINNINSLKKKILILGLDNSGKSSIVLCLRGVKNLESFSSLNPTKGIEMEIFETLGSEYTIWDYGGQEQYRNNNIVNLKFHINEVNKIIYVIDIQDSKRFDLALNYLNEIINIIIDNNHNVVLSIFLHKWDPDIEIFQNKIDEKKIKKLIDNLHRLNSPKLNLNIQKTSIYTVFQKINI